MPDSRTAGDGGQREGLLGGRYEDLGLVVRRDQNTCKSPHSVRLRNPLKTTFVSVITVHGLGRLSRTAWVVNRTVSFDTVAGPGLVSSTGVSAGMAPATPHTPDI